MQIFVEQDIFIKKSIIRTFYIKIVITDNLEIVIMDNFVNFSFDIHSCLMS